MTMTKSRCDWCGEDSLYQKYHDEEWGTPSKDEAYLFEMLLLEGAQAGLNWLTILKKRQGYRTAFANFSAENIAQFTEQDTENLVNNSAIVRHRQKIAAFIHNARVYLQLKESGFSLSDYLWQKVAYQQIRNHWNTIKQVPTQSPLSEQISKEFKKMGFKFVGPVTIYAYLQAVGIIDDHLTTCWRKQSKSGKHP